MIDCHDVAALLGNGLENCLQCSAPIADQKSERDNLITCRLKERVYVILIFVVCTAAEITASLTVRTSPWLIISFARIVFLIAFGRIPPMDGKPLAIGSQIIPYLKTITK